MNIKNFKLKKLKLKKIHISIIFAILAIAIISTVTITTLSHQKEKKNKKVSTSQDFDSFVDDIFKEMVTVDTLTLHYTLSKPKAYGINDYPITFGKIVSDKNDTYFSKTKKQLAKLETYNYKKLDIERQYVYDTLYWKLNNIIKSKDYIYYEEYLSPSSGVQIQLPILLSEYRFDNKKDIDTYLKLLPDIERYFKDICTFEEKKYANGLFMSKKNANKVLSQCKDIMLNISTSLYITEFNNKLEGMKDISQNERYDYQKRNEDIVLSHVLNAYTNMYSTISKLNKNNTNTGILCSYTEGKEYYELYSQQITGSNRTIKNIISILDNTITQKNNALLSFINKNKNIDIETLNKDYGSNDGNLIINTINKKMIEDFPKLKNVKYNLKDVPSQLETSMGPAFYLVSPIDTCDKNTIYINKGSQYLDNPLYTNISHEAFPGHLYQHCYFNNKNKYPIRGLIKNLGYLEGWAGYATLAAYEYSNLDEYYAKLYKYNNAIVLCLSARADIGVHYEGWTEKEISEYFSTNNCPLGKDAIKQLYNIILEEPGDYLPYAVGYVEINRMLLEAKEKNGNDFNIKDFHTAILNAGPAPFNSIKSHIKY